MPSLAVGELLERLSGRLKLESLTGTLDPERQITSQDVNRPGLALTGFVENFRGDRIQIFGLSEIRYLDTLSPEDRAKAVRHVLRFDVPCVIVVSQSRSAAQPHPGGRRTRHAGHSLRPARPPM